MIASPSLPWVVFQKSFLLTNAICLLLFFRPEYLRNDVQVSFVMIFLVRQNS